MPFCSQPTLHLRRVLYGDKCTWQGVLGAALIVAGFLFLEMGENKSGPVEEETPLVDEVEQGELTSKLLQQPRQRPPFAGI